MLYFVLQKALIVKVDFRMNAAHEKPRSDDHVLQTPSWVVVARGFQAFLALIILALCARLMHDAYLEEEGFCLAMVSLSTTAPSPKTYR